MISADNAQQAADLVQQGASVAEIAGNWGVSPGAIYKAFKRHNVEFTRNALTPAEHIDMQAESGVPPELYAIRAGLVPNTLRRYAWDEGRRLAMNTAADRKAYWTAKIDQLDIRHVRSFTALHMLPLPMLAHWYHKLINPSALLLWGFNDLLVIDGNQFNDFARFADPKAELYVIGRSKECAPVGANIAGQAFRFARTYQHH